MPEARKPRAIGFNHVALEVGDIEEALAFYGRLFELDPALRAMFQHDMAEQGRKFMTMLLIVVRGLDAPERLLPDVQNLGRRHVDYGVLEEQYESVHTALLWALQQTLGEGWTPEVATAWHAAYTLLADIMIDAARDVPDLDTETDEPHAP